MENASKALLIAGGMLLLILVLSFAIFLFNRIGSSAAEMYRDLDEADIAEFNQQFFYYELKEELKIQDVVSIIYLAKDSNKSEKYPVNIKVEFWNEEWQTKGETDIAGLLSNINNIDKRFKCTVEYNGTSVFVGKITITEIP